MGETSSFGDETFENTAGESRGEYEISLFFLFCPDELFRRFDHSPVACGRIEQKRNVAEGRGYANGNGSVR